MASPIFARRAESGPTGVASGRSVSPCESRRSNPLARGVNQLPGRAREFGPRSMPARPRYGLAGLRFDKSDPTKGPKECRRRADYNHSAPVLSFLNFADAPAQSRSSGWRWSLIRRSPASMGADMESVRKALWFMEGRFGGEVSLDELSVAAGISRCHFAHVFARATGQSAMRYLPAIE